jgi:hypothetical protein
MAVFCLSFVSCNKTIKRNPLEKIEDNKIVERIKTPAELEAEKNLAGNNNNTTGTDNNNTIGTDNNMIDFEKVVQVFYNVSVSFLLMSAVFIVGSAVLILSVGLIVCCGCGW